MGLGSFLIVCVVGDLVGGILWLMDERQAVLLLMKWGFVRHNGVCCA